MRIFFTVQGEGRGHLTQALAVQQTLSRWGHEVVGVVAGQPGHRTLPEFFAQAFPVPVHSLPSPAFALRGDRSVDVAATVWRAARGVPRYRAAVRELGGLIEEARPDLLLNFFEPLTGILKLVRPIRVPVVSIAH